VLSKAKIVPKGYKKSIAEKERERKKESLNVITWRRKFQQTAQEYTLMIV